MSYRLGYITFGTPWKSSAMKIWLHHDAVFGQLVKNHDVKVVNLAPPRGEQHFRKVLDGRDRVLMNSILELKVDWREHLDQTSDTLDGLFLELGHKFGDLEMINSSGESYILQGSLINDYILKLVESMMKANKPIVLFDADTFAVSSTLQDKRFEFLTPLVYEMVKDYEHFTLMSPMKKHPSGGEFVPFNFDSTRAKKFVDKSSRQWFSTYVGNNYFRSQFADIFLNASHVGKVRVVGAGWVETAKKYESEQLHFLGKYAVTEDKAYEMFSNSVIGLYGNPYNLKEVQHFTLRHREYFCASTFIIPENVDYMVDAFCIDSFKVTTDDVKSDNDLMREIISMSDNSYHEIVNTQMSQVANQFECRIFVPTYLKALRIK